jgi:hypothetical protein
MVIYIEYALLENFFLDAILLFLTLFSAKIPIKIWRIALSAAIGAAFAVIYPLFRLPDLLFYLLKFSFGFFLCLVAVGRVKTRKEWSCYVLSCVFFFSYSFAFGGALTAVTGATLEEKAPISIVLGGFSIFTLISIFFIKRLYQKRTEYHYIYDCILIINEKIVKVQGFFDSGNTANKNGLPVCFVAPEIGFALWGDEVLNGKAWEEELEITTLGGKKKLPLYLGKVQVCINGKYRQIQTYFAPSTNIVLREYQVILNRRTMDGE